MDYSKTATDILDAIGGKDNIAHFEHCSTRLRFTLRDNAKAQIDTLKKIPGVLGVVMTAQCQVVIGNRVIEVYDEIAKQAQLNSSADNTDSGAPKQKQKLGAVILDFIVGVFQPLIPAIAGAGILKSLLLLIVMFGWTTKESTVYTVLNTIADSAFYFLPLLVANSAATKLKCNRYVSIATVGVLLLPAMGNLLADGIRLFGIPVQNIAYSYQVFPALLAVLFLAPVEKLFNKISPKPIRVFFVPLMTFLIVAPVTLLALGPLGFFIGEGFTKIIFFLFEKFGWLAVTLLAAALPFMIATGMHKAFVPYAVSSITSAGKELLYLPASLAHNISESGACFGVAIRAKEPEMRSTAFSAGISALFGITEPALYGVTIQNKRALTSVILGALCGGAYVGIMGLEAYAAVGPGIASISMYISEALPRNIVHAFIGAGIAFAVSLVAALLLWKNPSPASAPAVPSADTATKTADGTSCASAAVETDIPEEGNGGILASPTDGQVIPLSKVEDDVFSAGILGRGIALIPDTGEIYAPADGIIESIFDTLHAITLKTDFGAEVLIHCGLDTVKLGGKGFEVFVKAGEKVKKSQLIMRMDVAAVKREGFSVTTPVIIVNSERYEPKAVTREQVRHGEDLLMLTPVSDAQD